jgi:hypothetical protein
MSKLKVQRSRERKRGYWRYKNLKRKITRVIREEGDIFQWLIFFEAEKYERQHEEADQSTVSDLIIRYIKHLMQITTPMSSFYVSIGILRLLYDYSTAETRYLYERVSDHYPGNEEYRTVKGSLMNRLGARFGAFLRTYQRKRGEIRFEACDNQEDFIELVLRCLDIFTPWSTARTCRLPAEAGNPARCLSNRLIKNTFGKSNSDVIETYRSHAIVHPGCFENLTREVGMDSPRRRLGVPRFFLSAAGENNSKSDGDRETQIDLTEPEHQAMVQRLEAEAIKRRQMVPRALRIVIDGLQRAQLDLSRERSARCSIPENAGLIEIWAADQNENILFATHWIQYTAIHGPAAVEAVVDLGRTKEIVLRIVPKAGEAHLILKYNRSSRWAVWIQSLQSSVWQERWPRYSLGISFLLLMASAVAMSTYRIEMLKQRAIAESARKELERDRASRLAIQDEIRRATGQQGSVSYRLIADSLTTRGSQDMSQQRLTLTPNGALTRLELPVGDYTRGKYRATLRLFLGNKTVIGEDDLEVTADPEKPTAMFLVPSLLLKAGKYYVIRLETINSNGVRTNTETFTFYVNK